MASRLERLLSIDAHIRAANFPSLERLCQLFEVQPRTIYQDLRELREMFGLDIRFDRLRNGYYNSDHGKQLPPLAITYEEALLITLAIEMLAGSLGVSFRGALARAVDLLAINDAHQFSWLSEFVSSEDYADCEVKCSVMVGVLRAASSKQKIVLDSSESEQPHIRLFPLRINYRAGHWNLLGKNEHSNDLIEIPLCEVVGARVIIEDSKSVPKRL